MSQNQIAPLAIINVQENNFVAPAAPAQQSKEILSVATMTVSIFVDLINVVIMSQLRISNTIIYRIMMSLFMMAVTHTVWILISQKLRQFALQVFTDIRGWISIYTP